MCYQPSPRHSASDPFIWLDVLTVIPFLVALGTYLPSGVAASSSTKAQRVFEAFAQFRLIKLCRYYEGASILARAMSKSFSALIVPLFLLVLVVASCSSVLWELERDEDVDACVQLWKDHGVTSAFLREHPDGVSWSCDDLPCATQNSTSSITGMMCASCGGYPTGHPQCLGLPFAQRIHSIPHAMWFLVVAVTTVGFGDVVPQSGLGQAFIMALLLLGVLFIAMPIATVVCSLALMGNS